MTPPAGHRVRDLRKAKGMSQRELARLAKISPAFLSRFERCDLDVGMPGEATLRRIAAVLDFEGDTLVCLSGRLPADIASWLAARPERVRKLRAEMELVAELRRKFEARPKADL